MRPRIVIVGGGTGGKLIANRLHRLHGDSVTSTVIDRYDRHMYQHPRGVCECHKAGPAVTALLAVGLVIALRRLSDAQVRLERTRGPSGAVLTDGIESPFGAMDASEFAHQWEEAVPPMDS